MQNFESTFITLRAFTVSTVTEGVILKTVSGEASLGLNSREWQVLQRVMDLELTVDGYLKWQLSAADGLSFLESVELLIKLQENQFLQPEVSQVVEQKLNAFKSRMAEKKLDKNLSIKDFLEKHPLFFDSPKSQLNEIAAQFKKHRFHQNDIIFQQGDPGTTFFIIYSGRVEVLREEQAKKPKRIALLSPLDAFGEGAILGDGVRGATVRAQTAVEVLVLEKKDFETLFPEGSNRRQALTQLLRDLSVIKESGSLGYLTPSESLDFLKMVERVRFTPGAFLMRQGDMSEGAYLILEGTVRVFQGNKNLAELGVGELVGMTGVLLARRRNASVTSLTNVKALKISRDQLITLCLKNIPLATAISEQCRGHALPMSKAA